MKTLILIFLLLSIISFFSIIVSMYIHNNMKGTKLWRFINKHIIADEDEYLKNK